MNDERSEDDFPPIGSRWKTENGYVRHVVDTVYGKVGWRGVKKSGELGMYRKCSYESWDALELKRVDGKQGEDV
jgi:hypothetical protein